MAVASKTVVQSVQAFSIHLMELALAVLVHQQLTNHIQLLLLVYHNKSPRTLDENLTNYINAEKPLANTYCKQSLASLAARIQCDFTKHKEQLLGLE